MAAASTEGAELRRVFQMFDRDGDDDDGLITLRANRSLRNQVGSLAFTSEPEPESPDVKF